MDPNYAEFPGLKLSRADMVLTHGVTPSKCVVLCYPESVSELRGTLTFGQAGVPQLSFMDCCVDHSITTPPLLKRGQRVELRILDRRWRWKGVRISGHYNVRSNDCEMEGINKDTARNYTELITLLLEALGEESPDVVIPVPELDAPTVYWESVRADLELARIIEQVGCVVYLGLDDKIHVAPYGSGLDPPPNGREREPKVEVSPTSLPYEIMAKYGPTRYQSKILLQAVGLDNTGEVLPIDELSYKPSGGWSSQVPGVFNDVEDEWDRNLAKRTVFRWYRVYQQADGTLDLPGADTETVSSIEDILPLYEDLVVPQHMAFNKDDESFGNYPSSRPRVEGIFFNNDMKGVNEADGDYSLWDGDFTLDCKRGIVQFDQDMFQVDEDGYCAEAELYLECSYNAREKREASYWFFSHKIPSTVNNDDKAGVAQVTRNDIYKYSVQVYAEKSHDATEVYTNDEWIKEHAQSLAESYRHKFTALPRYDMQWTGVVPFGVDGSMHQMRWSVGDGQAMTYGSRHSEIPTWAPPTPERRLREESQRELEGLLE